MQATPWIEKLLHRASLRARTNLDREEDYQFLKRHSLFQEFSPPAFVYFYKHLIERRYKRHELIFKEGNPGICLFIVKKGRVEIFTQEEEEEEEVTSQRAVYTTLGEGTLFGELSLIAMSYRTSSARALEHGSQLLTLSLYDLKSLCDQYPRDGIKLMKVMAATLGNHLVEMDRRLGESLREIEQLKEKLAKHE